MNAQTLFPVDEVLACAEKRGSYAGYERHVRSAGGASACEECAEARRAYQKAYRKAYNLSPEGKAKQKAYDQSPAGKTRQKAYFQSSAGKASNGRRRHHRRARKINALSLPYDDPARLPGAFCAFCGSAKNPECEHLVSFARGGINTAGNTWVLCRTCNRRKGTGDYIGDVRVTPEYSYLMEDSPDPSVYYWLDEPISAAERQRFLSGETQGGETSLAEYPPEAA